MNVHVLWVYMFTQSKGEDKKEKSLGEFSLETGEELENPVIVL